MRSFVRVLPLLFVAAELAACAADTMARGDAGAAHAAAAVSPARPAVRTAARERPDQALLVRQPSPRCELSKPLEGVPPDQVRAAMLDYEQQCYRQRAGVVHAQLAALQDAAEKTGSFGSADRALLERQPPPQCEPAKPAAGLSPAEAREAALDAGRQCYRQFEASEREKLAALQDALRKSANPARSQHGPVRRPQGAGYVAY